MRRPDVTQRGGPLTPFQLDGELPVELPIIQTPLWHYAGCHLGFYGFLCIANARLSRLGKVNVLDMPSRAWRAAYDAGDHPIDEAEKALIEHWRRHVLNNS
jgi:hypothetical protein